MAVGIGGTGYVGVVFETVMGTYLPPNTAGTVFVPILEENLEYTEDKYMSRQIRQSAMVSEVKQSYYHVEGDITMEVDPAWMPYFLHASRHTIAKSGAGPYVYTYSPSSTGSATTAASGNVPRTLSISVIRNGIGFGYGGCIVGRMEFTIEDGVLRCTMGITGLSETTPGALGSPTWSAANLFGAADHRIFVDTAAVSPTFVTQVNDFNGFTFTADHNAEAQNRILPSRAAAYISYGEAEATYETELDFQDKTEYTNFQNTTTRAVKLSSLHGGSTIAAATDGFEIEINRSVYETYGVSLGSMEEITSAGVTGRVVGIAGGVGYKLVCKSVANIT